MNLRYHNLNLDGGGCLSIVSMMPQKRSIFGNHPATNRENTSKPISVWFPYTFFSFNYHRVPGGYLYAGIHGRNDVYNRRDRGVGFAGMYVHCRSEPMTSLDDRFGSFPTEHHLFGAACTDHNFDHRVFKTPMLLIGTLMKSWWNSSHLIGHNQNLTGANWQKMSLENVLARDWVKGDRLAFAPSVWLDSSDRRELIDQPIKLPSLALEKTIYHDYNQIEPDDYD